MLRRMNDVHPFPLFLALIFGTFIGAVAGTVGGRIDGVKQERAEAIQAGVAEYVVNPKTGETAFQYIRPKVEKP